MSSGLGGGSLIYANVLLRKDLDSFFVVLADGRKEPWPLSYPDLEPHYDAAEGQYVFNLGTDSWIPGIHQLIVTLDDGSTMVGTVDITIRSPR